MKPLAKAALVLLCLIGCKPGDPPSGTSTTALPTITTAPNPPSPPLPVIVVDEQHQATRDAGTAYRIAAAPGVIIDAANHRFEPTPLGNQPTTVHLVHGADKYYRADWNARTTLKLDATSLSPVRGKGPFPGFAAGEKYILAIGADGEQTSDGAMKFAPMWIAHLDVH
jgi:hypothetical protein